MSGAQAPVDPTSTAAWSRLSTLAGVLEPDLRGWFAEDPARVGRFTHEVADLRVDLSKNLLTDTVLGALLELAREVGVEGRLISTLDLGHRLVITRSHADIATDRQPRDDVLRLATLWSPFPERTSPSE